MEKPLETKINAVTVYQQGARLTHVGQIELPVGKHTVKIEKLTRTLDKESVRVRGTGFGKIVNVDIEQISTKISKREDINTLAEQIKTLEKKVVYFEQEMQAIDEAKKNYQVFSATFWEKSATFYSANEIQMKNVVDMEDHILEKEKKWRQERRDLLIEQEATRKELEFARQSLSKLGRAEEIEEYYEIKINLETTQAGIFNLEIQFQIPDAYWQPFYDVNLTQGDANVKLLANVYNTSQEEWKDIELEISSANLQPVRIIEPSPFIVREYVPMVYPSSSSPKMARRSLMKDAIMPTAGDYEKECEEAPSMEPVCAAVPPPPPAMQQNVAEIGENLGVQSFKISTRLSIPADNNSHPVTLVETKLASKKGYFWSVAAPDMIILKDTLTNGELLLLPGHAKVYYEGEFIGESELPLIAPGETVDLGTRKTYDLKVEKKMKDRGTAKEGMLKGKISKEYAYEIKITVLVSNENELKVMDRIVHSDSEKIKVNITQMSPETESKNLGILTWKIPLKGQKEIKLNYTYDVVYEKNVNITPNLP